MARCPFAVQRPISAQYLPGIRKAAHNRMSVHITAGYGSPFGFFNNPRRASSEFFVYKTGAIEQFIDSDDQGEGDYDGNDATHAVENEGLGNAPLTPQQVASNARLFRWLRETHGVPNKIATDSKVGASSHGLAWHRLGIDGNFPALPSIQAGRLQRGGGMHYSTSFGKICPGYDVVPQIPEIFALSQGATTPTPIGNLPDPLTPEDDDMIPLIEHAYRDLCDRTASLDEIAGWHDAARGRTAAWFLAAFRANAAEPGTVRAAYRALLGRAPESSEVASQLTHGYTIGALFVAVAKAAAGGAD